MSKELKVGLLGIVSIIIFVFGFSFLKRTHLLNPSNVYYAIYKETYGLQPDDPVYINGVQIGKVGDIELDKEGNRKVKVSLIIDNGETIPKGSIANLFSEDFLGEKSIKLLLTNNEELHEPGDILGTELEKEMMAALSDQFTPVTEKLERLFPKIDSLLHNLIGITNEDSTLIKSVTETMNNMASITGTLDRELKDEDAEIQKILANVESFTNNLEGNNEKIDSMIDNMNVLTRQLRDAELNKLIEDAGSALAELDKALNAVNEGNGPANAVLYDEGFKNELVGITENVNKLLEDFKANPQRYVHFSVFGKKDKTQTVEENSKDK